MKKDYISWHDKKSVINEVITRPFFREREIWYSYLGLNVGFEQDGVGKDFLRPVLIIRKFNNEIFWAVPLTNTKKKSEHYFAFSFVGEQVSTAILSQIRLIDGRRLGYKIGNISDPDFQVLIEKLKALLP